MKEYILVIDTTEENTGIALRGTDFYKENIWVSKKNQSEELLPNIDKLFEENNKKPAELKWVAVNIGPGSFTGLRIGISIANTFGYALKIPVIGEANLAGAIKTRLEKLTNLTTNEIKFTQILPEYGRPPRITKPKPKK
ncbi:MAG: tRNA (adenosine(37)-N6)-threonylcarbamoyltransferase complex dimerization subunit type 1 TsaB [Patescibacteria group bacterium]|nr:tRNA (adenosine(37)-N6)-threonylcarbamoyltransferase complex dimerization subunit type 1 TsaB [Patescibacteria group bacterium]